ncbi:MAG: ABC-F family ATP-binding cassette domain-containing protein [Anaerolineae bacterium]|nr:ABC-F family ATP-binding cassette domain-containing protein [Anaerolineae bacterium]
MIVVHLQEIIHHYAAQLVLNGVNWEVQAGQKIGLVGANGAGKSTLLRLIAGELTPDGGRIYRHKNVTIGYLAQEPALDPARTVWEEAYGAAEDIREARRELGRIEAQMADPRVHHDEAALGRAMRAYDRAQHAFEQLDGYRYESRVREALHVAGLEPETFEQPIGTLSGGQAKMVGLAKLLAAGANLLLLDEPDNHLDLQRKEQLERLINAFPGTVIIVSHDRYLLDETVTLIAEVEDHQLQVYAGNYTAYAVEKQLRLLRQEQAYRAQQKEIARIEAAIERFERWASIVVNERHARQARSRKKMLERMERVDKPVLERRRMDLDLAGWRGSNKVLEIADLDMIFTRGEGEEQIVLAGLDLLLWHGERVGLVGPNGAGKSVLMRCVLGELVPSGGTIVLGPSIRVGYYAQRHETLDPERTLIEEIRQAKQMYEDEAVSVLGRFLFPYAMARKPVHQLSGGERSRLQLAKVMLSDANLLLFDEPTNNLDLPSCEVLENALDDFQGTLLVISHDRYFLDRVVDRIVDLDEGRLVEYPGDYTAYRQAKEALADSASRHL